MDWKGYGEKQSLQLWWHIVFVVIACGSVTFGFKNMCSGLFIFVYVNSFAFL
jgi:hypothetical protein